MAYVNVPKDLTKVKTKVLFNLTKRQLICFGSGALIGVPLFLSSENPQLGWGVQERLCLWVLKRKTPFDKIKVRLLTAQNIKRRS